MIGGEDGVDRSTSYRSDGFWGCGLVMVLRNTVREKFGSGGNDDWRRWRKDVALGRLGFRPRLWWWLRVVRPRVLGIWYGVDRSEEEEEAIGDRSKEEGLGSVIVLGGEGFVGRWWSQPCYGFEAWKRDGGERAAVDFSKEALMKLWTWCVAGKGGWVGKRKEMIGKVCG